MKKLHHIPVTPPRHPRRAHRARAAALAAVLAASLAASLPAGADDEAIDWVQTTLTGDWGGRRGAWQQAGVTVEARYKLDAVRNVAGGMAKGSRYIGLFDFGLGLDLDKLAGWDGTTAQLVVRSHLGGRPNANLTGSAMGVSNSEVAVNTVRVFQAWIEKSFLDGAVALRGGLYPIDSEFYVTEASGVFLHPSYGMSAETAVTGQAGPSIYNTSALGLRLKFEPAPGVYVQGAILDGVPGDPANPRGTHIRLRRGDGAMGIAEAGFSPARLAAGEGAAEGVSKVAVGVYRYTPRFPDLVAVDPVTGDPLRRVSRGAYVLAEQTLFREAGDPAQGLSAFVRYGRASAAVNPIASSASIGVSYTGLVPGRDEDVFGLAVTRAAASAGNRIANGLEAAETVVELTYRAQVTPWFALQPSVQRILNPGFDPTLSNAWVGQLRAEIVF